MTEDFVVESLCKWLESKDYKIRSSCLGAARGNDIEAVKNGALLIVEAKGAKGKLSTTTRPKFDSGQIKTHLGKAIVKVLEQKTLNPGAEIAIAHPYDDYLMGVLSTIRPEIKRMGIKMYWVKDQESVFED
jgi:hypothetical protein